LLVRCARGHRARVGRALADLGVSAGQELVLAELWREDGLTQSELAGRLGIEPPTMTKVLARMTRSDLVDRLRDPGDARISRVHLTRRGAELRAAVEQRCADAEQLTFERLSPRDVRTLRALLAKLDGGVANGSSRR
jgi:DNA-binding MarR family transcriptional regulator